MFVFTSVARSRLAAWLTLVAAVVFCGVVFGLPVPDNPAPVSSTGLSVEWESTQAERLQAELPSKDVQASIVVVSRTDDTPLTGADRDRLTSLAGELSQFATTDQLPPPQVSPDGRVAMLIVPTSTTGGRQAITERVDALRDNLAELPAPLRAEVTGAPAFATDLGRVFEGADTTLLAFTASVVAVLLLITYRSPFLWLVPLIVVAVTEQTTLRAIESIVPAVGIHLELGEVTGIASVLVFGAATNYALLLIARYREELRREEDRFAAMRAALRRTAEPILASGGTVALGVLTLLLSEQESNKALAVACATGIVLAMASALIVLPAALLIFGRGLFWPFVPRVGGEAREGRLWGRLGQLVVRRPIPVAALSVLLLAGLALGGLAIRTGLSETEQFRVQPEAVAGAKTLAKAFPAGSTQPVAVLTTPQAVQAVTEAATAVPGVSSARPAGAGETVAQIDVVLEPEPGTAASDRVIQDLRAAVSAVPNSAPPAVEGVEEFSGAVVGGTVAASYDSDRADSRDLRLIMPIILLLVFAVLVLLLRGLLAPVLLVLTVVASFFASLGAAWLIFDHVLHFPAMDSGVLLLAFVFLVALGVDYNIFLVTRAREDARRLGTRDGMLSALRVTGGVITSAGILLAAVFAVLGVLPLILLTQIGIIVCIGVLLDTLLVRTVLVPALAFLLGDRFWWPGRIRSAAETDSVTPAPGKLNQ